MKKTKSLLDFVMNSLITITNNNWLSSELTYKDKKKKKTKDLTSKK